MSDDAHDDELGNLDDALFGDGDAKPAPPRDQAPKADIDWFAAIEETPAAGAAGAGAAGAGAGADIFDAAPPIVSAPDPEDFPDLVGDPEGSPDTEWVFQEEPVACHGRAGSVESRRRRPHRRRGDLRGGGRSAAAAPESTRAERSPARRPAPPSAHAGARCRADRAGGRRDRGGPHRRERQQCRQVGGEGGRHRAAHHDAVDASRDDCSTRHCRTHHAARHPCAAPRPPPTTPPPTATPRRCAPTRRWAIPADPAADRPRHRPPPTEPPPRRPTTTTTTTTPLPAPPTTPETSATISPSRGSGG